MNETPGIAQAGPVPRREVSPDSAGLIFRLRPATPDTINSADFKDGGTQFTSDGLGVLSRPPHVSIPISEDLP